MAPCSVFYGSLQKNSYRILSQLVSGWLFSCIILCLHNQSHNLKRDHYLAEVS